MADTQLVKAIAANTGSEAAQLAALRISTLRGSVLTNKKVTDAAFTQVFKPKTRVTSAKACVKRTMSETQMLHVLDNEERIEVITTMLKHSCPTPAVLDRLAEKGLLTGGHHALAMTEADKKDAETPVDAIARYWGQHVSLEWIESLPDPVPGRLRLWRLRRRTSIPDADVAAELATFDQWGSNYDQGTLQWLLASRPNLIHLVAGNDSTAVMTAVAGSHLFGQLTADEQARALHLDRLRPGQARQDWADLGATWFNTRAFAWMAAGGNPTTHDSVLQQLIEPLAEQTESPGAERNIKSRLKYRNWRIDAYEIATDSSHLAALVQHVAPGGKKPNGRPHSVPALVANPHLGPDEAYTLARMIRSYTEYVTVDWSAAEVRTALATLEERFPEMAEQTRLLDWHDQILDRFSVPTHRTTTPEWDQGAENVFKAADLDALEWDDQMRSWFESQVGDDVDAWFAIYQLVLGGFQGTAGEVAMLSGALV